MASGISSGQKPTGVTDLDSVQTLENKTLDSSSSVNGAPITGSDIISPTRADVKKDTLANLQTYALTAANGQLCFATDAKKMYQVLDAALAEVGTGSGGINYISNPDFELNADGWVGDANLTIARSTSSPSRGDASGVVSKAAVDATGQVVKIPFTIESADLAKKLYISADVDASDANYADGDLRWKIVKDPNGTPVTIRPNAEDILGGNFSRLAWFQSDASITEYELQIECNSVNPSAYSVKIDNVSVGPREAAFGSATTDWKSYTPTGSWTTNTTYSGQYRRVGDNLEVLVQVDTSGAPNSTSLSIDLPNSLSIDSNKLTNTTAGNDSLGNVWIYSNTTAYHGTTLYNDSTSVLVQVSAANATYTYWNGGAVTPTVPNTFGSGNFVIARFSVPIQGWSSNSLMSEDIGNREVFSSATRSSNQSLSASTDTTVIFDSIYADKTNSYNNTTGEFTAPEKGVYTISGHILWQGITSVTEARVNITVNGTGRRFFYAGAKDSTAGTAQGNPFNAEIELEKGDIVKVVAWTQIANSILGGVNFSHVSFRKNAQPQTLLETETVAARYTSDSGQSTPSSGTDLVFEDLDFDTHNAYNNSTGVYTVPVSGIYDVNLTYSLTSPGDFIRAGIKKNGDIVASNVNRYSGGANYGVVVNSKLKLEKGDEIIARHISSSSTTVLAGTAGRVDHHFSIARIK